MVYIFVCIYSFSLHEMQLKLLYKYQTETIQPQRRVLVIAAPLLRGAVLAALLLWCLKKDEALSLALPAWLLLPPPPRYQRMGGLPLFAVMRASPNSFALFTFLQNSLRYELIPPKETDGMEHTRTGHCPRMYIYRVRHGYHKA